MIIVSFPKLERRASRLVDSEAIIGPVEYRREDSFSHGHGRDEGMLRQTRSARS